MMDKSKIDIKQVDNHNRLKGLKNRGTINFECADCGHPLLVLQLASVEDGQQNHVLTRIAVDCGICGGYSHVKQISGQFYPGAPNDNMRFDIIENDGNAPDADILFKAWNK